MKQVLECVACRLWLFIPLYLYNGLLFCTSEWKVGIRHLGINRQHSQNRAAHLKPAVPSQHLKDSQIILFH